MFRWMSGPWRLAAGCGLRTTTKSRPALRCSLFAQLLAFFLCYLTSEPLNAEPIGQLSRKNLGIFKANLEAGQIHFR